METNIDDLRGKTNFEMTEDKTERIIKVLGVGGGGGNAVTTMFNQEEIKGVSYLLCNTDKQALMNSPVPDKIILGPNVTMGLGAGNKPQIAKEAAEESAEDIRKALTSDGTKMVFITAGMGGGTGTGAAPIIGRIAQEAKLLTVGIVTIPFRFEGPKKIYKALEGVQELKEHVDALLVVNNERLIDVYKGFKMSEAFDHADATLSNAARGISDMINNYGRINLDFKDVQTTLEHKGIAVISSGYGIGNQRLDMALKEALNSPLLNNNNIMKATHLLIAVYSPTENGLDIEEVESLTRFTGSIESQFSSKFGYYNDDNLEPGQVKVTLLASGFDYATTFNSIDGRKVSVDSTFIEPSKNIKEQVKEYYGEGIGDKSHKQPLLLTLAELDKDELIYIAEESPSLNRDLRRVEEIRSRYKQMQSSSRELDTDIETETVAPEVTGFKTSDNSLQESEDNTIYFS